MDTAFFTKIAQLHDKSIVDQGRLLATAQYLLNLILPELNIHRAGFWLYDSSEQQLTATLIIDSLNRKQDTTARLHANEYPEFFLALNESPNRVFHFKHQPNLGRLTKSYLNPLNVKSMLSIAIRVEGQCVGYLQCESIGEDKHWTQTDQLKAIHIADIFSRCVAASMRQSLSQSNKQSQPKINTIQAIPTELDTTTLMTATNAYGIITEINQNYLQLTGYTRSEIIGQTHQIFQSQKHKREYFQMMWRLLEQGRAWRGRLCNKKKNGEIFWLDATIKPIYQSSNTARGFIGFYHDITEQVETEQQLKHSEKLAKLGSFRQEIHKKHWLCSEQLHQLLQIPQTDLITIEHFKKYLDPINISVFQEHFNSLLDGQKNISLILKTKRPDDQWIRLTAQLEGTWIIGNVQDITETHLKDEALQQTISFQKAIFDAANFTVVATDTFGTITHFNQTAEHLLGYQAKELIGIETPLIFHDPEELAEIAHQRNIELSTPINIDMSLLISDAKNGKVTEHEWHYISRNGQRIPIALSVTAIKDAESNIKGYLGVGKDLRKLKQAEKDTSRLDTILSTAGQLAQFGGFQYDVDDDQLHLTHHNLQKAISPTKSAIHFKEALEHIHPDFQQLLSDAFKQAISTGKPFDIQIKIKQSKDRYDWLRCAGTAHIIDQRVQTILGFIHTINEQKDLEQKLSLLALTDELTGLNNRRALMQAMESEWHRFHRYQSLTTLLILDIDFFKQVNDQWGHDVGDHVLVHFAKRIKGLLRSSDTLGRLGGEEFLILTSNNTEIEACLLAEKIRKTISDTPFKYNVLEQATPLSLNITISIGVAALNKEIKTLDQWLIEADKALYQAKLRGRNQVISVQSMENNPIQPSLPA
jgi:diguanylate cyclase (GGDEF)-like protein/PAS domain S-box-containing protein